MKNIPTPAAPRRTPPPTAAIKIKIGPVLLLSSLSLFFIGIRVGSGVVSVFAGNALGNGGITRPVL